MNLPYSTEAPFPEMRAAWMRAIARAWRDPAYKKKLQEQSAGPRGVLPMLEEDFRFVYPFNVKLVVNTEVEGAAVFDPAPTTGWRRTGDWQRGGDSFTIWFPMPPKEDQSAAEVLGCYCEQFPSLLGKGAGGQYAPPDFAAFGLVTSRLVAMVWDPKYEQIARSLFASEDARAEVRDLMACIIPWNFNLKFKQYREGGPSTVDDAYWASFPRSEVLLHLPLRPDPEVEAIAIASYNADGGAYPFTCVA